VRRFLPFLIIAGLGIVYLWQKHNESAAPTPAPAKPAASVSHATPSAKPTPAPRGVASEHNWMKRALDRAADVRDQSRAQTKESQDP
jgi:hypothetical protein